VFCAGVIGDVRHHSAIASDVNYRRVFHSVSHLFQFEDEFCDEHQRLTALHIAMVRSDADARFMILLMHHSIDASLY